MPRPVVTFPSRRTLLACGSLLLDLGCASGAQAFVAEAKRAGLPLLQLRVGGAPASDYRAAKVSYGGRAQTAAVKLRGRSSLEYPQHSYTLKFTKADPIHEPALGTARRRVVLISPFDDNSLLRQRLAFSAWNRLRPAITIGHRSVVLLLDGRYEGVYTLANHIDGDLLLAHGFHKEANLYKMVDHAGSFYDANPPAAAIEKKNGRPAAGERGADDDLRALFAFITGAPDEQFRTEIATRIALDDYLDWMVLTIAIQATDSLGKNAYHFRNPNGGRFHVVPWDFNASWGQSWETSRDPPHAPIATLAGANRLFQRLLGDPVLGPTTRARFRAMLTGPLALESVLSALDSLVAEVSPAAPDQERRWGAAYRQFPRWRGRRDFTDFSAEIAYLRAWIRARWAFLLGELSA